ncbi:tRNA uridine 5-carboxymethylaminomethyl modification enzyme MnmG [Deltaproteobacteria bacterium]|nr:tRNA uridine 5-carboxymethylaminomethyl modification enzyme MnmG [Deltaproteobacteria bacterium]
MDYDVVVVGGGHAGCEAALAAARLGRSVALVTLFRDQLGRLSCNPAVGGLAKGTLVREIDALGGAMARVADATTIQFRRLNTRKGLAVQASRAQVDIDLYPKRMAEEIARAGVVVVEGEAADLEVRAGRISALLLGDGTRVGTSALVLTTGTFLGGVLHCGRDQQVGGRVGEGAAHTLSLSLTRLGLRLGRLKTGTTPRLDGRTVAWDRLHVQPDALPGGHFAFTPPAARLARRDCYIAFTNEGTHAAIRASLGESPMYSGAITGRGPRYCPSIEDKVTRFPEKDRHQLFLEPEGLNTHRIYVNGTSTSLPAHAQDAMIRSIEGLESAVIEQYGYAVEYDFVDPTQLSPTLEWPALPGLFFAGQVNGTSGYEEAAAQGLVAGVNAAGVPLVFGRDEACIGVMIDDLTQRGVGGEPYRMFPSRCEHRLVLREDNADRRLMPRARALGLLGDEAWARFEEKAAAIAELSAIAPASLRRPEVFAADLFPEANPEVAEQVEIDVKYAGYVVREGQRQDQTRRLAGVSLAGIDFAGIDALSIEARERLTRASPATLADAARVPGVTPAAIQTLTMVLIRLT